MRNTMIGAAALIVAWGSVGAQQHVAPKSSPRKIASALSAAPREIGAHAAVVEMGADGGMSTLREGTNGWSCMADNPATPGTDPMCADQAWQAFMAAIMAKQPPKVSQIGIAYMLAGGADASNTDPFAEKPSPGEKWVRSGPHTMVLLPDPKMLESYPSDPGTGGPYIMWKGTPYAHLMVPMGKPR